MRKIIETTCPGSYLRDYLEEMQMSYEECANQLGITEEQLS